MNLEVATYRRMAADLQALQVRARAQFMRAVLELATAGVSGLETARRLGCSQPHAAGLYRLCGFQVCFRRFFPARSLMISKRPVAA